MHVRSALLRVICCLAVWTTGALAAAGGDHPLVGHYEGAELVGRHVSDFDEVELVNGPISTARGIGAPGWLHLEGRVTLLYYALPEGRSSLEILRNHQASLESKGFKVAYTCATGNGSCYEGRAERVVNSAPYDFALAFDANPELPRLNGDFIRNYFGTQARYLLARLARPEGAIYASIVIAEHSRGNHAFIRVVETKEMDTGKIGFIDAGGMQARIADSGRVSLYGIHFDFDKDAVRPDSKPTLDEIAKLLRGDPALRLSVVGHTDSKGGAGYNHDLSQRRAANVRSSLVDAYGIDASRLDSRGAGAAEPVASNDDEDGRARNRRVELVKR